MISKFLKKISGVFKSEDHKDKGPGPCGSVEHWFWEDGGVYCPICQAIREKEQREIERERERDDLAEKIVNKLWEKMIDTA